MLDEASALRLQVPDGVGDRGALETYVLGDAVVVVTGWVEIAGRHAEAERHPLAGQPVGRGPQLGGIVGGIDVLEAHERPMALGRARRQGVEQQVREDDLAIGLVRVGERDLADVGEVAGAQGPRERGAVGAYGAGKHGRLRRVERRVVHDAGLI